jgi:hypothetical protein
MSRFLSLSLLAVLLPQAVSGQSFVDRRIDRVALERDSLRGSYRVVVDLEVLVESTVPGVNLGFRLDVRSDGQLVSSSSYTASTVAAATCLTMTTGCGNGTCAPLAVGGLLVQGVCKQVTCKQPSGDDTACTCSYSVRVEPGAGLDFKPGTKVEVDVVAAQGSASDTSCSGLDNDRAEVWVGSQADAAPFHFPGRAVSPVGGQDNSPAAALDVPTLVLQGEGPYECWGEAGAFVPIVQAVGTPGAPATLLVGRPLTKFLGLPGLGSIDLDLGSPFFALYDGLGLGGFPDGTVGSQSFGVPLPANLTLALASLQGASISPTAPLGLALTARLDLGVQDRSALPAPDLPPLSAPGPLPAGAQTTVTYPFPRPYVVFPNHGFTNRSPSERDGTLFSALGAHFDAVAPAQMSATVNGIPVDVFVVRPTEVLFRLTPPHRAGIGGPLVLGNGAGVDPASPDQMEHQVFARPFGTRIAAEEPGLGEPLVSGAFLPAGGLQAVRGVIDAGSGRDIWTLLDLGPGVSITAFLGQIDANGQIVTRCQTQTLPPVAGTCFSPSTEPLTQAPSGLLSLLTLRDPVLRHADVAGGGISVLATQDDGGPGVSAFAGRPPIPGPATDPALDPDVPFVSIGGADAVLVDRPSTLDLPYLLIVSW